MDARHLQPPAIERPWLFYTIEQIRQEYSPPQSPDCAMPLPSSLLLLALVCCLVDSAAQAAERFSALFADGSRIAGEELRDWYDTKAEPKLADRKLLDPKNP